MATARTPMDNLKQWELVEHDHRLQVIEKGSMANPSSKGGVVKRSPSVAGNDATSIAGKKAIEASLEEKLKAFRNSNIVQPIAVRPRRDDDRSDSDAKLPVKLELILKQRKGSGAESTDMLQRLEQQVKAIEMDTLAARTRQLEISSDFEPEILYTDLRYREHEDLLRNVTDDEAEG